MIFLSLLLAIVALDRGVFTIDVRRLFYEKDLSEYCKRRVIPSIFLGRHVVEASAYILHFTKLNLPYNCFISVRSEAGSNMIMVITLPSNSGLEHACSESRPQLLVYEMGETFGGYWGMLPEVMLKQKPPAVKYYTLKTTQPTTQQTEPRQTNTEEYVEITSPAPTPYVDPKETQDYIRVEVPIVDVSGHFERGSQQPTKAFDFEEAFDYQYDVTPIPGVKYDTSILPLVQLSVRKQTDDGRRGYGQEPRYELDVVEEFTQDPRLKPTYNQRHRTNANRRLSFARNKPTKALYKNTRTTTKSNTFTKYVFPTTMRSNIKHKLDHTHNSWEVLDKLVEALKNNENYEETNEDNGQLNTNDGNNKSQIAETISNMEHNSSIYLQSNLSVYNDDNFISSNKLPFTTKRTNDYLLPRTTASSYRKRITSNKDSTLITQRKKSTTNSIQSLQSTETIPVTTLSSPSSTSRNISEEIFFEMGSQKNATNQEASTETNSTKLLMETVPAISLVDHESWENIVQAAPGMAVLLNQSVPYNISTSSNGWSSLNETYRKEILKRKKRAIQLIAIDSGRPHNMTTKAKASTTTKKAFNVGDMQEFARLVELEDDNIHGRVALRYLKQYVGPAIYNICADTHIINRHIYLFNSSRIVLSLNNFTLSSISVIITGARTLLSNELRCPNSMLECQVSGARVCVDSLAACDGVPNCGSYDIYDEDRLMCGAALGLQHNVYLAAFTFLAFLLTLFYVVHYWLKQCVPKVAEAFFVYTDGTENILYLDSIMRSPGDYDDGGRIFYRGNMNSGELVNEEFEHYSKQNICSRLFRKCFFCFWKKQEKVENEDKHEEILTQGHRKTYSFTQMELNNMMARPTVETSVQTGDSLEMAMFEYQSDLPITTYNKTAGYEGVNVKTKGSPMMIRDSLLTLDEPLPEDELSLMKFFRDSRSNSIESDMMQAKPRYMLDSSTGAAPGGEQELSSIMYDDGGVRSKPGPSVVKQKSKANTKVTSRSRKRIRFDEAPTMISSPISDDDDDDEEEKPSHRRQTLPLGPTRTWRSQHLSTIKEDDESGNRHRHFWESKRKKSTKKGNVSSR